jgi:hypothetical protein
MRGARVTVAVLVGSAAIAAPIPARDTAFVGVERVSVGVFAPLTWTLAEGVELRGHPLLFFVAPNAVARVSHGEVAGLRIAGEYGLSVPTLGMRMVRGYLFPTGADIPWLLIPSVGLVASRGDPLGSVWSVSGDAAYRISLSRHELRPMNAPAPLEVVFAAAAGGYRVRLGGGYDAALGQLWRLRGYGDVFWFPAGELSSPFALRVGAAAELAVGRQSRFTFGAVYWNSDQGRRDLATGEGVRSHDVLPTIDFIWAWR